MAMAKFGHAKLFFGGDSILIPLVKSLAAVHQMPTVAVDKADLWERLGKEYSQLQSHYFPSFS